MARAVMFFTDSPGFGGAEQVLLSLIGGLDRHGWRAILVHHAEPGVTPLVSHAVRLGARICPLPPRTGRGLVARARETAALVRVLRLERPSVFHANLAWPLAARYALVAASIARVPLKLATVHSFGVHISPRDARIQRLVSLGVDRYIAVSQFVAHQLTTQLGVPERKVCVVPNGIRGTAFVRPRSARIRAELAGPEDRPIVLTPARLDPVKGHRFLLAAAVKLPGVVFVFAGDGCLAPALMQEALRLGVADRVRFLGHRADIADLLASSDVVVLPSLSEGFGLAAIEAMAARIPVVATSVGAFPEIVTHGRTGLLVPPADPDALAATLQSLLADPSLATRLANAARERVLQEFSAERMVADVARAYDRLLAERRA